MSKTERKPAIRPRAKAEELAKLHPVERAAMRLFEFLASLQLAIIILTWLIVELIVGALAESRINTPAARYLVYNSWHFHLCLMLLGVVILCAALIRFPWKRYQTGFVVTHVGLLVFLFGCMLTLRDHLDCLLVAKKVDADPTQSKFSSRIFDPDRERIQITELDPFTGKTLFKDDGKTPVYDDSLTIDPGPFTWGHRLWGWLPWKDGAEEKHALKGGIELRIKKFYANCDPEETYVPAEKKGAGISVARVSLSTKQGGAIFNRWVRFGEQAVETDLQFGAMTCWECPSKAAFDHFLAAKEVKLEGASQDTGDGGLLGKLTVVLDGKKHQFRVDDLRNGKPVAIAGTKSTIEVVDYLPEAKPGDKPGTLVRASEDPNNPALKVQIKTAGKATDYFCAADEKLNSSLAKARGAGPEFKYLPAGAIDADLGTILLSHKGGHHSISVRNLQTTPFTIPGTSYTVKLLRYLPDPIINGNEIETRSEKANNPAVELEVSGGGGPKRKLYSFTNAALNSIALSRDGEFLLSYFTSGGAPSIQLAASPEGRIGYRLWGSGGLLACRAIEMGESVPAWNLPGAKTSAELKVAEFKQSARRDWKLFPLPLEKGEKGTRGMIVELQTKDGSATTSLFRIPGIVGGGQQNLIALGDHVYSIAFTHWEMDLPFSVRLDDFKAPKIPGTNNDAAYISLVTLKDESRKLEEKWSISMNRPLRYTVHEERSGLASLLQPFGREYKLYQTNIARPPSGPESTYTVSYDPGILVKYVGGVVVSIGIVLMFYMGGYFRSSPRKTSIGEKANLQPALEDAD